MLDNVGTFWMNLDKQKTCVGLFWKITENFG